MTVDIAKRKADHIQLAVSGEVGFRQKTNLFECVELIHDALPDLHADAIELSTTMFGKRLRAPLIIAAMTGGTDKAGEINRTLARIADERGYGFGLGSQRAMHVDPKKSASYQVRADAKNVLLLGNIGVVQAREMTTDQIESLVKAVDADALCVHLNPAMEIVQPGGDRDFSNGLKTIERIVRELHVPVIVKETGCGLSRRVAERLFNEGVRHVDVSGAGGTSWVAVETRRAEEASDKVAMGLGDLLWDWGIPTAASVALVSKSGFDNVIATGGVTSGLDVAKAIALGATAAGIARPVLQALVQEGESAAHARLDAIEAELRAVMLLVGASNLNALKHATRVIRGDLRSWMDA